jgi:WD40 repeat protein/predicted Ser/Thr protein kinase
MSDSDIPAGSELFGYRVEGLLGRGGMGLVYLCEDPRLHRRVALKVLTASLAEDVAFRKRFIAEAELAASLDHAHVVPIYEAGDRDGRLFIAMRYVEGSDLKAVVGAGPLEAERALRLCAQVADALDFAHERGLVHGDVKPSNVLLDTRDHAYLADFGVTRRLEEPQAVEPRLLGTIDYAAPELIRGDRLDGRADQYSLGCLLYECLTGGPPFARPTSAAVLFAHLEEPPPAPAGLEEVMQTALAKNPEDRYPTCRAFLTAVAEALGLDEAARTPGTPARGSSVRRWLAAAGAVIVAIAAMVLLTTGSGSSSAGRAVRTARSQTLAAYSEAQRRADPELAVLLGAAAVRSWPTAQGLAALHDAVEAAPAVLRLPFAGTPASDHYACDCLAYSPDGRLIAQSTYTGFVVIIDAHTGRVLRRIRTGPGQLEAWSPDGRLLLVGTETAALVIDAQTGRTRARIPMMTYSSGLAFSPDGSTVYGAGFTAAGWKQHNGGFPSASSTRGAWVGAWALASGSYRPFTLPPRTSAWAAHCVCSMAVRPGGRELAVGGWPGVAVFDTRSGKPVEVLAPPEVAERRYAAALAHRRGHYPPNPGTWWVSLAYSPDGSLLAGDAVTFTRTREVSGVELLNADTLRVRQTVGGAGDQTPVAFSPDGTRIGYEGPSGDATVFSLALHTRVVDVPTRILGNYPLITSVAFSPDGTGFATAVNNGDAWVWSASGHAQLQIAPDTAPRTALFAALQADKVVAVLTPATGPDAHKVVVESWSRTDGHPLAPPLLVSSRTNPNGFVSLSGDGRFVAVLSELRPGDADRVAVWDIKARRVIQVLKLDHPALTVNQPSRGRAVKTLAYNSVDLDPDSAWSRGDRYLAIPPRDLSSRAVADPTDTGVFGGPVMVIDRTDGRVVPGDLTPRCSGAVLNHVAWSPDASLIAAAGNCVAVQVWNPATGRRVLTINRLFGAGEVGSFSPDGRRLIVYPLPSPETVYVLDARTGHTVLVLSGINSPVQHALYSPDGRFISTSSTDGSVRIWNAGSGALLRTLRLGRSGPTQVEFGPHSSSILTVDAADEIRVSDTCPACGNPAALLAIATDLVTRGFTPSERSLYHVG